jgi:hypothetical protein
MSIAIPQYAEEIDIFFTIFSNISTENLSVGFRDLNDSSAILSHNRYGFELFNKLYHTRMILKM